MNQFIRNFSRMKKVGPFSSYCASAYMSCGGSVGRAKSRERVDCHSIGVGSLGVCLRISADLEGDWDDGGSLHDVDRHPDDSARIYATCGWFYAGLFESLDGAQTWKSRNMGWDLDEYQQTRTLGQSWCFWQFVSGAKCIRFLRRLGLRLGSLRPPSRSRRGFHNSSAPGTRLRSCPASPPDRQRMYCLLER